MDNQYRVKCGKIYEKIVSKIREEGYFKFESTSSVFEKEYDVTRQVLLSAILLVLVNHDDWKVTSSKTEPHVIYLYDTSREGLELK